MRLLLDAQLPPGLARRLVEAGHDAVHLHDVLPPEATDLEVAREADRRGSILVSKDEDFADLSRRGLLQVPFLWIRFGNTTNARLWQALEPSMQTIEDAFANGETIVELR